MGTLHEFGRQRVLLYDADEPPVNGERRAADLIGEALGERATLLALPVGMLDPAFFRLRSGLAGAITQKLVNYRLKLAVIGDITAHLDASGALRDWVRECERGGDVLFVPNFDALVTRLGGTTT